MKENLVPLSNFLLELDLRSKDLFNKRLRNSKSGRKFFVKIYTACSKQLRKKYLFHLHQAW